MKMHSWHDTRPHGRYYHVLTEAEKGMKKIAEARAQRQRQIIHRPIRHPYFKNVSTLQATELLHDAEVGEYLLRPSTRGTSSITLTMKVGGSLLQSVQKQQWVQHRGVGADWYEVPLRSNAKCFATLRLSWQQSAAPLVQSALSHHEVELVLL